MCSNKCAVTVFGGVCQSVLASVVAWSEMLDGGSMNGAAYVSFGTARPLYSDEVIVGERRADAYARARSFHLEIGASQDSSEAAGPNSMPR